MNEEEWQASDSPRSLLFALEGPTLRKQVLFAAACWRLIWGHAEPCEREEVAVWERFADGMATAEEVVAAREAYGGKGSGTAPTPTPPWWAILTAEDAAEQGAQAMCGDPRDLEGERQWSAAQADLERRQSNLLRDIFGNPFRLPPTLDPAWLTGTVKQLALSAYEERELPSGHLDRHRLAVLADALEEAGCQEAELLGHLRSEQVHVRGCWAVDVILSRQ